MALVSPPRHDVGRAAPVGTVGNRGSAPLPTVLVPADIRPPWRTVFGAILIGLLCTLLGAQGAFLAESMKADVWQAVAEVEFRDPSLYPQTVARTFESPSIWHPIAEREGYSDEDFQEWYQVEVAGGTQIIRLAFADTDSVKAQRVVDGIVDAYFLRFRPNDDIRQTEAIDERIVALEDLEAQLVEVLQDRASLERDVQIDFQNDLIRTRQRLTELAVLKDQRLTESDRRDDVAPRRITQAAYVGDEPIAPSPVKGAVFGAAGGGLVGVVAVYLTFHRSAMPGVPLNGGTSTVPQQSEAVAPERRRRYAPVGHWIWRAMKRLLDLVGSGVLLLVLSPVFLVIAIAVKLTSRGPAIFKQERIGRNGEVFQIKKFRTMTLADDDPAHRDYVEQMLAGMDVVSTEDPVQKLRNCRVTKVGAVLRRLSLDEMPQMLNVLRGEMSLVGPRPALPWEHELYTAEQQERVRALPGCSGLWQTSGRSLLSVPEMLELDIDYIEGWSLWRDIKILLLTPFAIVRGDGAR